MVEDLEHLSYKERLRQLGLEQLSHEGLSNVYEYPV